MLVQLRDWLIVAILRFFILTGKLLPWEWRIRIIGAILAWIMGIPKRARVIIEKNTRLIYPEWSDLEHKKFVKMNLRHFGQNLVELYNIKRFAKELPYFTPKGEGWSVLKEQRENNSGAVCVSGHIGQWEAIRAYMKSENMQMAGLYKETSNPYYEKMFREALEYSGPMFHTGVRGMAGLVKILRGGGFISLLHDQRIKGAPLIDFMGVTAHTSLAAAEMALKYNVPLIPIYGIKCEDGRHYDIIAEAPIPPSDPETMTRAMNDSLARQVRAHPEQWLWSHDRWRSRTRVN